MSSVCDFYCCYQSKLQLDLVNANLEINSTAAPMRNRENKKKEDIVSKIKVLLVLEF